MGRSMSVVREETPLLSFFSEEFQSAVLLRITEPEEEGGRGHARDDGEIEGVKGRVWCWGWVLQHGPRRAASSS